MVPYYQENLKIEIVQHTANTTHPSSSCSSSHSISPLPHTSSGNSSPPYPLSSPSEAECTPDAIILSSEDDQQGSLPVTDEPESAHTSTEMSTPTAEGESSQSFFLERPPQSRCLGRPLQECYYEQSILAHDISPVCDCIYVSLVTNLSLFEYFSALASLSEPHTCRKASAVTVYIYWT